MYRRRGSSHQFLSLAEEAGHLGFWSLDLASGEMLGSPGLARIVGLPPSADPRGILDEFIHPVDRAAQADLYDRLHDGRGFARTYRIIRADRRLRWIKVRADIVLGSAGVPARAEGIVFDVTEPEQARHRAEQIQARHQGLLQAIGAVVWIASPEGHSRPNAGWEALTGQTPDDLCGDGWLRAIHEPDRETMMRAWRLAISERSPLEIEVGIVCRDGEVRRYRSHGAPLLNEDGTMHEWIGVLIPTEASRSEASFEASGTVEADGVFARAGRALLGWSMAELASRARVSVASVKRFEDQSQAVMRPKIRQAILTTLMQAGVAFDQAADGTPRLSLDKRRAGIDRAVGSIALLDKAPGAS